MNKCVKLLVILIVVNNTSFAQKNSLRVKSGLIHLFCDNSPIFNQKYESSGINNGVLINSLGISYLRVLKKSNRIEMNLSYFNETYHKHFNLFPIINPIIGKRVYSTLNFNYCRVFPIKKKLNLIYGAGVNFRIGNESIIIDRKPLAIINGQTVYEVNLESVKRMDLGINTFISIEYIPTNWLTLYSTLNVLGFLYFNDKKKIDYLNDVYNIKAFPSRFDISLNFGIGINF